MNDRYFICRDSEKVIEAGYRWAYWKLEEPGIVSVGREVDVATVIGTESYWVVPSDERSDYLDVVLPAVRTFLDVHREHEIVYGDIEGFPFDEFTDLTPPWGATKPVEPTGTSSSP